MIMASLPECKLCAHIYNSKVRRPVILQNCGHTMCDECFNVLKAPGVITCPEDNKQSVQEEPVYNYEVLSQIEKIEVPCDSCDNPSEYVCTGCMKFQCGVNCNTSHNCPNKFQEDLTQINLANLLIEKINLARQHRQAEPHRFGDIRKKTCAELKVELRREEEGQVFLEFCLNHPTKEGEFLDIETLSFKCKLCEFEERKKENEERKKCESERRPFQGRRLEQLHLKGEDKNIAKEFLNQLIQDRFVHKESFLIPPTLLKFIGTDKLNQLTKILKFLECGKSFMPHCPKCLVKLTDDIALKYPCAKAHLICRNCPQERGVLKCIYDGMLYRNYNTKPIALKSFYSHFPVCPICTESSDLRVLPCNHSFCTACIAKTRRCPICRAFFQDSSQYPVEPFLKYFTKLKCFNEDDGNAVKISKQTGQVFCDRCFTSENKIHTFSEIPARPHEFLESLISRSLVQAVGRDSEADREFSDHIIDLREMIALIPKASRELIGLLNLFPRINLSNRARLLYYVRTDLTNCDIDNTEECVGWRIPAITVPDLVVAMRFKDVLPPQFCQDISRPSRSPWHVDLSKRQIEIVGLMMFSPIKLHGIVMATSFGESPSLPALESFKIFNVNFIPELGEALMLSYRNVKLFSFNEPQSLTGPLSHKVIMFPKPFKFMAKTPYILKFSLSGSHTFYRGNTSTLDEHRSLFGPDGTFFTFLKCQTTSDKCLYGRNDLSGPLLGLIYIRR